MVDRPFILASRSPRRIALLREAGFQFDVDPADIDEEAVPPALAPIQIAAYLATSKARVVSARHPGAAVLGADTVVAVGASLYGKADTPDAARAMLTALGGKCQDVLTGVALLVEGAEHIEVVKSVVEMRVMTTAELDAYLATGQWRGKAGAYGIQDQNPDQDRFVRIVEGDYTNVVGLPMPAVIAMLERAGIRPTGAQ